MSCVLREMWSSERYVGCHIMALNCQFFNMYGCQFHVGPRPEAACCGRALVSGDIAWTWCGSHVVCLLGVLMVCSVEHYM